MYIHIYICMCVCEYVVVSKLLVHFAGPLLPAAVLEEVEPHALEAIAIAIAKKWELNGKMLNADFSINK